MAFRSDVFMGARGQTALSRGIVVGRVNMKNQWVDEALEIIARGPGYATECSMIGYRDSKSGCCQNKDFLIYADSDETVE